MNKLTASLAVLVMLLWSLTTCVVASAQTTPDPVAEAREALARVSTAIDQAAGQRDALRHDLTEAERVLRDEQARVRALEAAQTATAAELAGLRETIRELEARLGQGNGGGEAPPPTAAKVPLVMNLSGIGSFVPELARNNLIEQATRYNVAKGEYRLFGWTHAPAAAVPRDFDAVGYRVEVRPAGVFAIGPRQIPEGAGVWLRGADRTKRWNPQFLDRMRPFQVLRFMDWQGTNFSPVTEWGDYLAWSTDPEAPDNVHTKRLPVEWMIDLANELDADPWFCMPHLASDDYVRRFATLVRDTLEPGRKVYLETSNEHWNSQFAQWHWYNQMRVQRGEADAWPFKAERMARDRRIWREVFGADANRIVYVVSGQADNPWHVQKLTELMGRGNFEAVSCSSYLNLTHAEITGGAEPPIVAQPVTADGMFDALLTRVLPHYRSKWAAHAAIAREYGVPLIAYEGGQHVTPNGRSVPWMAEHHRFQRSERQVELTHAIIQTWLEVGGTLPSHFNHLDAVDIHGGWGAVEYWGQPIEETPKQRALLSYPWLAGEGVR